MWPFVLLLSFFLVTLILLTACRLQYTKLKDVIRRLFWHGSVRKPKESYIEKKYALHEKICENPPGEKVIMQIIIVSTDAIFICIEAQQDSTPSQVHLVILRKKKVNFLSICIIMVICVLLLLNFCVIGVVELFHVQLFVSFAIIVTDVVLHFVLG